MPSNNATNNILSGSTGSGSFVAASSPTLVTPTLGVATATSINFGGSALSSYVQAGTFTPTFFATITPPTTITFSPNTGTYTRIGNVVFFNFVIVVSSLTLGPAAGSLYIAGLPIAANGFSQCQFGMSYIDTGVADNLVAQTIDGTTTMSVVVSNSGVSSTEVPFTSLTSLGGTRCAGFYFV